MTSIYRPNRKWAAGVCGMMGVVGMYLLFSVLEFKLILTLYAVFLSLLPVAYVLWANHTYVLINEDEKTVIQVSSRWNRAEYRIQNITKISWTGSPMDGINVCFEDESRKLILSPGLYDKPTLKEIVRNLISLNHSITLEGRIRKALGV